MTEISGSVLARPRQKRPLVTLARWTTGTKKKAQGLPTAAHQHTVLGTQEKIQNSRTNDKHSGHGFPIASHRALLPDVSNNFDCREIFL